MHPKGPCPLPRRHFSFPPLASLLTTVRHGRVLRFSIARVNHAISRERPRPRKAPLRPPLPPRTGTPPQKHYVARHRRFRPHRTSPCHRRFRRRPTSSVIPNLTIEFVVSFRVPEPLVPLLFPSVSSDDDHHRYLRRRTTTQASLRCFSVFTATTFWSPPTFRRLDEIRTSSNRSASSSIVAVDGGINTARGFLYFRS